MAIATLVRVAPSRRAGRIVLADFVDDGHAMPRIEKVWEALELVLRVQPWRHAQLQRHLRRILIIPRGGQLYDFRIRACVFDAGFVASEDVAALAGALVHEGVHARLADLGVRYEHATRARIERLAVAAQVHFLLSAGAKALAEATAEASRQEWWGDRALFDKRVEQMRGFGAPSWLIRLYRKFADAGIGGPHD